ncbi:hypothetical protein P9112_001960 [Eukaryota sp. TZLM1-RC]
MGISHTSTRMPSLGFFAEQLRDSGELKDPDHFIGDLISSLSATAFNSKICTQFCQDILPHLSLCLPSLSPSTLVKTISFLISVTRQYNVISAETSSSFAPSLISLLPSSPADVAHSISSFFQVFFQNPDNISFFSQDSTINPLLSSLDPSSSTLPYALEVLFYSSSPNLPKAILSSKLPFLLSSILKHLLRSHITSSSISCISLVLEFIVSCEELTFVRDNLAYLVRIISNSQLSTLVPVTLDCLVILAKSPCRTLLFNHLELIADVIDCDSINIRSARGFSQVLTSISTQSLDYLTSSHCEVCCNLLIKFLNQFDNTFAICAPSLVALSRLLTRFNELSGQPSEYLVKVGLMAVMSSFSVIKNVAGLCVSFLVVIDELLGLINHIEISQLDSINHVIFDLIAVFPSDNDVIISALTTLAKVFVSILSMMDVDLSIHNCNNNLSSNDYSQEALRELFGSICLRFYALIDRNSLVFGSSNVCAGVARVLTLSVIGSQVNSGLLIPFLTSCLENFPSSSIVLIEVGNLLTQIIKSNYYQTFINFYFNGGTKLLRKVLKRRISFAQAMDPKSTPQTKLHLLSNSIGSLVWGLFGGIELLKSDFEGDVVVIDYFNSTFNESFFDVVSNILGIDIKAFTPQLLVGLVKSLLAAKSFYQNSIGENTTFRNLASRSIPIISRFMQPNFSNSFTLVSNSSSVLEFSNFILGLLSPTAETFNCFLQSFHFNVVFSQSYWSLPIIHSSLILLTKISIDKKTRHLVTQKELLLSLIQSLFSSTEPSSNVVEEQIASCTLSLNLLPDICTFFINSFDLSLFCDLVIKRIDTLVVCRSFLATLESMLVKPEASVADQLITPKVIDSINSIIGCRSENVQLFELSASCLYLITATLPSSSLNPIQSNMIDCVSNLGNGLKRWPGHYSFACSVFSFISYLTSASDTFPESLLVKLDDVVIAINHVLDYRSESGAVPPLKVCLPLFLTIFHMSWNPIITKKLLKSNILGSLRAIISFHSVDSVPSQWILSLEEFQTNKIREKSAKKAKLIEKLRKTKEKEKLVKLSTASKTARYRALQRQKFREELAAKAAQDDQVLQTIANQISRDQERDGDLDEASQSEIQELKEEFAIVSRETLAGLLVPYPKEFSSQNLKTVVEQIDPSKVKVTLSEAINLFKSNSSISNFSEEFFNEVHQSVLSTTLKCLSKSHRNSLENTGVVELVAELLSLFMDFYGQGQDSEIDSDDLFETKDDVQYPGIFFNVVDALANCLFTISIRKDFAGLVLIKEFEHYDQISSEVTRLRTSLEEKGKFPPLHVLQALARKNLGLAESLVDTPLTNMLKNLRHWRRRRITMISVLGSLESFARSSRILAVLPPSLVCSNLTFMLRSFRHRPFLIAWTADLGYLLSKLEGQVAHLLVNDIHNALRNMIKRFVPENTEVVDFNPTSIHSINSLTRLVSQIVIFPNTLEGTFFVLPYLLRLLILSTDYHILLNCIRSIFLLTCNEKFAQIVATAKSFDVISKFVTKAKSELAHPDVVELGEAVVNACFKYRTEQVLSPTKQAILALYKRRAVKQVRGKYNVPLDNPSPVEEPKESKESKQEQQSEQVANDGKSENDEVNSTEHSDVPSEDDTENEHGIRNSHNQDDDSDDLSVDVGGLL